MQREKWTTCFVVLYRYSTYYSIFVCFGDLLLVCYCSSLSWTVRPLISVPLSGCLVFFWYSVVSSFLLVRKVVSSLDLLHVQQRGSPWTYVHRKKNGELYNFVTVTFLLLLLPKDWTIHHWTTTIHLQATGNLLMHCRTLQ